MRQEDFKNPPAKFRGAPFWAWNCKLEKEMLRRQIGYFKEMGMGGFHMHCRTGMDTEYLGQEFMDLAEDCNETAKKNGMLCWLYDEDRYASGFGGGYVTRNIRFRERYLLLTPEVREDTEPDYRHFEESCEKGKEPAGYYLCSYRVTLKDGILSEYQVLEKPAGEENIWNAYLMIDEKSSWWNNQTYVNTLDPNALKCFIETTHERYYERLGEDFGKSIPAIFTDEPQFMQMENLSFAGERRALKFPFTDDLEESFRGKYGYSLLEHFPEVVWEQTKPATVRYHFIDHLTDRFSQAYAGQISRWCENHNIAMTGHMKGEETLKSQTVFTGETMRSLQYFHIPGHDVLCDQRDYPTAKMAQSIARQMGRYGALSETYGVTNWDFDFKGHKMSGDWQAALGIGVRVHHVSWLSMRGEAKRDYPASINYQSPWYREYSLLETYFGRVNAALTSGSPSVKVGIIHPVESFWMVFGPNDQTSERQLALEEGYRNLCDWLTFGLIDFDYISEAVLEKESGPAFDGQGFVMGQMRYQVILVPGCLTLRSSTRKRLEEFAQNGGTVLILGEAPCWTDGKEDACAGRLEKICGTIPFERGALMRRLEPFRDVEVLLEDGSRADNLVYQMRTDEEGQWLFIAHGFEKLRDTFWSMVECRDYPYMEKLHIHLKGEVSLTVYDAMTGEKRQIPAHRRNGRTETEVLLGIHDSLLLRLESVKDGSDKQTEEGTEWIQTKRLRVPQPWKISREEPNVLILDRASYRIDEEAWQPEDDILRLDNICRSRFGYPPKEEAGAQPWTIRAETDFPHMLSLRFTVKSTLDTTADLALEDPDTTEIIVNGMSVNHSDTGWYVDEAIRVVKLPQLKKGTNLIELRIPYGEKANVENCYLLGDFGVENTGRENLLIPARKRYVFGDLTRQGMPFYGGNLTYHCSLEITEKEEVRLKAQYFEGPLLGVTVNKKKMGIIAFAPYELSLGELDPGVYELEITAYGNRYNTFGQLHNCDENYSWFASCSWRTKGDRYCEEYLTKRLGLWAAPEILTFRKKDTGTDNQDKEPAHRGEVS